MKLQRLIAILTVLLQKDRISAAALAEKFEVSVRTIYRDIEALECAGIPIVSYAGVNGGLSIVEQYKIDKKLFTDQDISTLLISLYSIAGSMPGTKVNQTLEKIKSLISGEHGRAIELTTRQLYIDMTPWSNHPHISQALKQIQKALEEQKLIQFSYTLRCGETTERTAEPHQLVLKENNWYLRAFCLQRQDFRIFKLRRMDNITLLQQKFETREFENNLTDFKDWKSDKVIVVELIVDDSLRERVLDYCREEHLEELDDGRIHIRMPFVESEMGYSVLLGMGYKCEVIAPAHIRAEVIRRISLMTKVYE